MPPKKPAPKKPAVKKIAPKTAPKRRRAQETTTDTGDTGDTSTALDEGSGPSTTPNEVAAATALQELASIMAAKSPRVRRPSARALAALTEDPDAGEDAGDDASTEPDRDRSMMPPPNKRARSTASSSISRINPNPPETPSHPPRRNNLPPRPRPSQRLNDDHNSHDSIVVSSSSNLGFRTPSSKLTSLKRPTKPLVLPDEIPIKITSQAKWLENTYLKTLKPLPSLPEKTVKNIEVEVKLDDGKLCDLYLGADLTWQLERIQKQYNTEVLDFARRSGLNATFYTVHYLVNAFSPSKRKGWDEITAASVLADDESDDNLNKPFEGIDTKEILRGLMPLLASQHFIALTLWYELLPSVTFAPITSIAPTAPTGPTASEGQDKLKKKERRLQTPWRRS